LVTLGDAGDAGGAGGFQNCVINQEDRPGHCE